MFKFAQQGKVFWPITLSARDPETGDVNQSKAYIQYSLLSRDEMKAREKQLAKVLSARAIGIKDADALNQLVEDAEAIDTATEKELLAHVHDWRDIADEAGEPIAFSTKLLKSMFADPLLFDPISRGLIECSKGAPAKNSLPGPGGTPGPGRK